MFSPPTPFPARMSVRAYGYALDWQQRAVCGPGTCREPPASQHSSEATEVRQCWGFCLQEMPCISFLYNEKHASTSRRIRSLLALGRAGLPPSLLPNHPHSFHALWGPQHTAGHYEKAHHGTHSASALRMWSRRLSGRSHGVLLCQEGHYFLGH